MAIHLHLASLLLLAAVPLSAQTNPVPAQVALSPGTGHRFEGGAKATDAHSLSSRRR